MLLIQVRYVLVLTREDLSSLLPGEDDAAKLLSLDMQGAGSDARHTLAYAQV
jgi:hypothetical protein